MTCDEIKKALKSILKQFKAMTTKIIHQLNKLGFNVIKGGKHYKVYFKNIPQCVIIACTASDRKAGANCVTKLYRQLVIPYYEMNRAE